MGETSDRLATALADRYRIERELGQGGMATVYLAEDLRHRRHVALKLLRPELAASLGSDRFLREIQIAAGLTHPHILPLHDSGEAAGTLYYVMPYVDGESLRDRLNREKQLPIDDALRIAREVADALSYAHSRGVVHRDVKPENILLESGHAVVADFGIARAISAAGGSSLTGTGMAVGTPAYMSPEQAAGESDLDGRSDLYSLACVLYEMLAGQPPFTGPTIESLVRQHMAVVPPSITLLRPAVPAEVAAALMRALAKAPADRFNPVGQFAEALSRPAAPSARQPVQPRRGWVAGAIGAVVVMAVAGWLIARQGDSNDGAAASTSVAVLPFEMLAADSDATFVLGMHAQIVTQLGKLEALQVASRTAALRYRGSTRPEREIARELSVAHLLTGSVQRSADQVRVNVALGDARNGRQVWAESYDRQLTAENLFAIQGDIARAVAAALRVRLTEAQQADIARAPTTNLQALDLYHRALQLWDDRGLPETDTLLVNTVARAVSLDPQFAAAWGLLAMGRSWLIRNGVETDTLPARQALDRIHALAQGTLEDRLAGAYYDYYARADYRNALEDLQAADSLLSSSSEIPLVMGLLLRRLGRWDESLVQVERALARDGRSLLAAGDLATTNGFLRRFDESEAAYDRVLAVAPSSDINIIRRFYLRLYGRGDSAGARAFAERSFAVLPPGTTALLKAELALVRRDYPAAVTWSRQARFVDFGSEFPHRFTLVAGAHALAGDRAGARAWADSLLAAADTALRRWRHPGSSDPFGSQHYITLQMAIARAHKGDTVAAIAMAERTAAAMAPARDAVEGPLLLRNLATVYLLAGRFDRAIDLYQRLLSVPSTMTRAELRLHPMYDPLRGIPRFQALIEEPVR